MARQHDEAVARGEASIHDTLKEGDLMLFTDSDLGIEGSIIIDTLIIKEGEDMIPKYTMTLREEKAVGSLEKSKSDRLYCRWWAGNRWLEYPTDTVYHPFTGQSAFSFAHPQ